MLTTEQLDNWLTYHAPTEETAPKYAAIREAEVFARGAVIGACSERAKGTVQERCERVTVATRALAEVIDANAPDCADKTAAIRCVRIARNAANEAIVAFDGPGIDHDELVHIAVVELLKARWQANSAIACGGK